MPPKDHYKTLGIPAGSALQDIKEAYRKLAFKYHPDKNPDNAYAAAFFMELHDAYQVLSDTNKRKVYDEELWLSGMGKRMQHHDITPQWLLHECNKLYNHMHKVDTYRMSHHALSEYILMLLSDAHMAVLLRENDTNATAQIIERIMTSTQKLQIQYIPAIMQRLAQLAGNDNASLNTINNYMQQRQRKAKRDKYFPVFIIALTLALVIFMYLYGRK